ncbi:response regulator [Jannaschia ovalis]|uniref:Response regulator n=1 Tax=Jannaschia ovalis TaxID=3038773 RepID=A0ABY8LJ48_9RHOB|nr:response regulator [Jannaschia sp. GRR-S6-38]WGH80143.1 response regulator [Jannaschia sp. GRR-S6-38]
MTALKVLAIDDSRTIRSLLSATLERAGFEVRTAEDGVAGVDSVAADPPDVIITDINMPRLDGFGVIDAVRRMPNAASVPILVLSTEGGDALKQRARAGGATGWIVKPFDDGKLVAAIRRVAKV